jgi:hypothetical protein
MKSIKVLGPALVAALMAISLVTTSAALAESTALCTADENPCAVAHQVGEVQVASVGNAKLLTSVGTIECKASFSGKISTKLASPLVISGNFTYTECKASGLGSCTAEEENGPSEIKVLKDGHEEAKVTGEGLVHLVCSGFIDCSYNGTGLIGTGKGPLLSTQKNGEVTLSEQTTTKEAGGFLCPKTAKLDLTMTPVGEEKTLLVECKEVVDSPKVYIVG